MPPLVSVVTLTHNKLECSRRCLSSLLRTNYSPWELIVVDNGSTDGTREWLPELRDEAAAVGVAVRHILNDGNIGCSTARNQGIAEARGERVVFVDNDIALRSANWLRALGERLDADPDVGIVGPKLVYPFEPYDIQCAGVGISRTGRVLFRGRGERRDDPRFDKQREMQCLISACFMLRRSVLEKCGGFDEAFNPVEFEDFDLCYRARSMGFRILYVPTVEMYHFESVTTQGTASLPNTGLIIRHGLLFKERWRHMFEHEDGPPDEATRWRKFPTRKLSGVGELPLIGETQ